MKRFEYKILDIPDVGNLNGFASDGWKVVLVLWREDGDSCFGQMDRVLMEREIGPADTGVFERDERRSESDKGW